MNWFILSVIKPNCLKYARSNTYICIPIRHIAGFTSLWMIPLLIRHVLNIINHYGLWCRERSDLFFKLTNRKSRLTLFTHGCSRRSLMHHAQKFHAWDEKLWCPVAAGFIPITSGWCFSLAASPPPPTSNNLNELHPVLNTSAVKLQLLAAFHVATHAGEDV